LPAVTAPAKSKSPSPDLRAKRDLKLHFEPPAEPDYFVQGQKAIGNNSVIKE